MDPDVVTFALVVCVAVSGIAVLTGIGVLAHRFVERTNRLPARSAEPLDDARLQRIEQALDAIAMEVERLGEGQRFVTKVLAEHRPELPAPEATPQRGRSVTPH